MEGERFMKNILTSAAIVTALFCGAAIAQDTTPSSTNPSAATPQTQAATPSTQPTHVAKIAPGSVIPVQLTKTVDAKKVKTGDEVIAKVTQDMKTTNGEILVPKDAKVVGHVTQAQARNKDQKESQVGIEFDRTETKAGEMQMPMSIQAIIGQQKTARILPREMNSPIRRLQRHPRQPLLAEWAVAVRRGHRVQVNQHHHRLHLLQRRAARRLNRRRAPRPCLRLLRIRKA